MYETGCYFKLKIILAILLIVSSLSLAAKAQELPNDTNDFHQNQNSINWFFAQPQTDGVTESQNNSVELNQTFQPLFDFIPEIFNVDVNTVLPHDSVQIDTTIRVNMFPVLDYNTKQFVFAMPGSRHARPSDPYGVTPFLDGIKLSSANGALHLTSLTGQIIGDGKSLSFNLKKNVFNLDGKINPFKGLILNQGPYDVTHVEWKTQNGTRAFDYYGSFIINREKTPRGQPCIQVINVIDIERYVAAVIPAEMNPALFPLEALESQAKAARSFAYTSRKVKRSMGLTFDVAANTQDQLYLGKSRQLEKSDQAALNTPGQVIVYKDQIILAMFHANSGGQTVAYVDYSMGHRDLPYLESRVEMDPRAIRKIKGSGTHYRYIKPTEFAEKVRAIAPSFTDRVVLKTLPGDFNSSGRATSLRVVGPKSSVMISGNNFRNLSRTLHLNPYMGKGEMVGGLVTIPCFGIGHGVGLSQEGAKLMAKAGKTSDEILKFYYPHTKIINVNLPQGETPDGSF